MRRLGFAAVVVGTLLASSLPASADEVADTHTFVTSFDGTRLQVHLMRTDRVGDDGAAPTVMIAHGFGEAAPSDPDAGTIETARHGRAFDR
jgi:hypothetical protein